MTIADIVESLGEATHRSFTAKMSAGTREILEREFLRLQNFMPGAFREQIVLAGAALISAWLAGCEDQQRSVMHVIGHGGVR